MSKNDDAPGRVEVKVAQAFELLVKRIEHLTAENEALRKTAPLCDKHQPKGGTRSNCVICIGERLQAALSRISYACGEPNEMEVSSYDVHFNGDAVVNQVQKLRAENEAQAALLRQAREALKRIAETHGQWTNGVWAANQALHVLPAIEKQLEGRA